jgi:hypothetical protein
MSWREVQDWRRFDAHNQPLPDRLADLHHALLRAQMVNMVRSAESAPAQVADFLVIHAPAPPIDDGLSEIERQMRNWRGG